METQNKQPEALRLADALSAFYSGTEAREAEAELRRLHALIAELVAALEISFRYVANEAPESELEQITTVFSKAKE